SPPPLFEPTVWPSAPVTLWTTCAGWLGSSVVPDPDPELPEAGDVGTETLVLGVVTLGVVPAGVVTLGTVTLGTVTSWAGGGCGAGAGVVPAPGVVPPPGEGELT